jgi:hypothetical protein
MDQCQDLRNAVITHAVDKEMARLADPMFERQQPSSEADVKDPQAADPWHVPGARVDRDVPDCFHGRLYQPVIAFRGRQGRTPGRLY